MTTQEFTELAKALYEPIKELAHIMKKMNIKDTINLWMMPHTGTISAEGSGMKGWELIYNTRANEWRSTHSEILPKEFFISIDEDLPFEPERSDAA